ncbi:Asp-tRNA(Asn)/Glu-tRNA(Gln) amidotransferase subunit GatA [Panacibacter ginsenosidivorans]|uniref:Glutamyl-tRNA(Gln) amidotransferase subunit A n=1 Tax=Panacibacter ginsenosidivorans TaxID=1813871 RepID=A0A5B8V872_9BACT|nr:Asp-tRNA(Asn)/Glu-tRNA(Gln) amidotransferase subunit GatA [Panacibacter ginsenosidivorans]QEC67604.1 Asp-tRNA(Asn)/Glu-tRNA(Gln) amidotransferase subunit GatA [Panacibacter ginsenosidivorans]
MFSFTSIKDYQTCLLNGQTSCVEAVSFYLAQIRTNSHLNAFLEVYNDEALKRAAELDAFSASGHTPGKLHGVVVALKDVICHKEHKTSAGSKILENYTAIYNATAVERLLAAGAIIIGRNNCDEFAMGSSNENSAFGAVLNAKDSSRVPGGSSGGSAVAVQAGLCMVSLGSDTGGSVRQPADFCGIVGLKPGYGKVSRYGLIAYASSFDQIGIFANSVEDAALTLEAIAGPDEFDSTISNEPVPYYSGSFKDENRKYKIAYFNEALEHPSLDKEIATSVQSFMVKLQAEGHTIEPVHFDLLDYIVPAYYILTTAEASSNLSRFDGIKYGYAAKEDFSDLTEFYKRSRSYGFGKEVKRRIMLGTFVLSAGYYDAYFTKAQQVRKILANKTNEIFNKYDVLVSPTVPAPAFKLGEKSKDPIEMFLADIYTVFANLAGIPGISLPLFSHSSGMPFGLQVMAARENELTLLQASKVFMQLK